MGPESEVTNGSNFEERLGDWRQIEEKERLTERAWRRRIPRDREDGFFSISFPDSFNAENLSICN